MTIFDHLKLATKTQHQSVEKVLIGELKNLQNAKDYANLLHRLYAFYAPVEAQLQNIINENFMPDIKLRQHMHRILQDLSILGYPIKPIDCNETLQITTPSYGLGVLYVIEGSTLGGQIISAMLIKQLNLNDATAISYFSSYKDQTLPMWKQLKSEVLASQEELNEHQIVSGAKDTFDMLRQWLLKSKPLENITL
ncbi:biliverdin-producing heme oxygenase [Aquimarina agarivorans]|uniref:biliverdin-producing heme oxygenase n=1 Tax=Aquimarina agarivorans TaxID=980584 RepID=UPI000248FCCF|nr:biliverdin-producing heme oxygenase [Aquimarina agarivorans]